VQEWERAHTDSTPSSPSALASEIEPAVDRAILRCLAKDPAQRPASAAQVAAALPGGDPLAAALAAGETPSPELVAASGEEGTLPRWQAWAWLAACLVAIAVVPFTLLPFALAEHVPFDLSPDTLQVRARDIVRSLGYADAPVDTVWWFRTDGEYLDRVNAMRPSEAFTELRNARPGPVRFCYRQSAVPLVPLIEPATPPGATPADNPAPAAGDVLVETDLKGRLVSLRVLPMPSGPATSSQGVAWAPLMTAAQAGPPEAFVAVESRLWPESAADAREAREGTYAGEHVRLEAASRNGLPVFFRLTMPRNGEPGATAAADAIRRRAGAVSDWAIALQWTIRIALFVLAWRNVRVGRGDRASALRLGIAAAATFAFAAPLSQTPPARNLNFTFMMALGVGLHTAIIYLGLEPALRRVWPQLLVTWTRLMHGQWRDPLVGRALLAGVLCGSLGQMSASRPIYRLMNLPGGGPTDWSGQFGGPAQMVSRVAWALGVGFVSAVFWLGLLLVLRLVLRRGGLTWTAVVLLAWVFLYFGSRSYQPTEIHVAVQFALAGAFAVLLNWVLWKHGALALATTFFVSGLLALAPWTLDLSRWYAWRQFFVLALVAAIAVWGFRNVLGKQSAFPTGALDG
jgi:serine/threonine-protein kinase